MTKVLRLLLHPWSIIATVALVMLLLVYPLDLFALPLAAPWAFQGGLLWLSLMSLIIGFAPRSPGSLLAFLSVLCPVLVLAAVAVVVFTLFPLIILIVVMASTLAVVVAVIVSPVVRSGLLLLMSTIVVLLLLLVTPFVVAGLRFSPFLGGSHYRKV